MAARARGKKRDGQPGRVDELVGVLLLMGALFATISLVTYDADDGAWWFSTPVAEHASNWGGHVGATVGEAMLQSFGTCALLVPGFLYLLAWNKLRRRPLVPSWPRAAAFAALFLALCALLDLLFDRIAWGGANHFPAGGGIGHLFADAQRAILNTPGALIFSATLVAAVMLLTTRLSFVRLAGAVSGWAGWGTGLIAARWKAWAADRAATVTPSTPTRARRPATGARDDVAIEDEDGDDDGDEDEDEDEDEEQDSEEIDDEQAHRPAPDVRRPAIVPTAASRRSAKPIAAAASSRQSTLALGGPSDGGYALPPLEMLREPEPQKGDDEADLLQRAVLLTQKFQEFKIGGTVDAIHPGPVVTTFEFKPEAGIKYSRITSLVNDLAMGLRAEAVRIDRVPGKATVGIEVPNRHRQMIYPRELLGSDKFANSPSKLTIALGKDIGGDVYVAELDRMPHLMIAGATGAGKSVGLNMMIASILYKATPHDVRFIMIDTKMIELGLYADIPHLLVPVVTDPKNASAALKWAVREMENRYRRLASVGVRNITQFNDVLEREPDRTMTNERTGEEIPLAHLPYLVIVIDEMADLMMVSSADVEESIMRLAQMARAVGIHLILATQRPSVDVITGVIKANFPCRIAFRVSQRVDSRTIIDQQGAEHLLGRGDMLFIPPQSSRMIRLHGAYMTEAELNRIITFLKKAGQPTYDESVLEDTPEGTPPGYEGGEVDEKFYEAVRLVLDEGQCSITMIQRRLRLGYARAARVVDSMEQAGIVSRGEGAKPREVLVGPEILATFQDRS